MLMNKFPASLPWMVGLFTAGLIAAQEALPPETPPAETPAAEEAAPADPAAPVPPADPAAIPADLPPAAPSNDLLPDIPPGTIFPQPTAASIEKRKSIAYQEKSEGEIGSLIEEALDEVSERRISLMEAVQIALLNDPLIKIAEEELALTEAARRIARGSFDPRLVTGITYEQRHAELSEAEIQQMQDQYNRNHALILASKKERLKIERELEQLKNGETPASNTKEGQLQQELNEAALELLKQLGVNSGIDVGSLDRLSKSIQEQGIETRREVIKTLNDTERTAVKQNKQFPVISVRRTDTTSFDLSIVKQFRNGISLSPYYQYDNSQNNVSRRGGSNRVNRSEVGIDLTIPLGRGLGTVAASGHEMAAQIDIEASQLSLQHTIASRILAVATNYWNLAAAQEQLAYLVRSEITSAALAGLADNLIKADELPAADASQTLARRAQSMASRINGEIALQQAQQNLALAMGVTGEDIIYAPLAADPLPSLVSESSVKALSLPALVEHALSSRADYRSSRKVIDSGKLLTEQARLNVKPRVDLNLGAFYTGRDEEGSKESAYHLWFEDHAGAGFMVSLRMDWPFFLNEARGAYQQRQADLAIRREQTQMINNQIVSGITQSHFTLKATARELRKQQEAVDEFEKALGTERERFRLGLSTMIDAIQTEERLTLARAQLVATRAMHAQALARLRFETGTLMPHDQAGRSAIARSSLVSLPVLGPEPVDDALRPRTGLQDARNKVFGETDPYRVLQKINRREQKTAPPAAVPDPSTARKKSGK